MITGFDHFVVFVRDLQKATKAYRELGFETRAGGEHPAFGSHNALIPLADGSYIELVAFRDPSLAERTLWGKATRISGAGGGLGSFVLGSDDLSEEAARLEPLGIGPPAPGSRMRPDGKQVAWRTAVFDGSVTGVLPFLIQDVTERSVRIEPAKEGIGLKSRAKGIVVAARDLDSARRKWRALVGKESYPMNDSGTEYLTETSWGEVVLADAKRLSATTTRRRIEEGLFSLSLAVEGFDERVREMNERGVELIRSEEGYLVSPEAACGARIILAR